MHPLLRCVKRKLFSLHAWKIRLTFWLGAVFVGTICVLFIELAEFANQLFLQLAHYNAYLPLVITPLGITTIAWLTLRFFPGAQGSGIPQTLAALKSQGKNTLLSLKIAFSKALLIILGVLSGASIGCGGPSVHIGASIMYELKRISRFPAQYTSHGLILAGSAAGITAAFNAPIAGVVFAFEEMLRSYKNHLAVIVVTAVLLTSTAIYFSLGHGYYFAISADIGYIHWDTWIAVFICGGIGGLLGGLLANAFIAGSQYLAPLMHKHPLRIIFIASIALAIVGFLSNYTASGIGHIETQAMMNQESGFNPWYPLTKMLATLASYLTGIPGGIFTPSLATGAGIGANLATWIPIVPWSSMILLGMVGYFTGVIQSPLTAFIIVMEITGEYDMFLPLMATAFIAYGISHQVSPKPLYHTLAQAFVTSRGR
jgi:H+/Cl- antiporter ClcA